MIDALIRWSLAHRAVVVALAAAFLVWGGWTASRMPVDVLPDLTAPTVTILAEAPGMDPLEIEALVTFPIESALNGAAGVRRVRSATAVGIAVVWVEFDWGTGHPAGAADRRREAHAGLRLAAAGVAPPFLAPVSSIMGEILFVDLESDRHSPLELRTTADGRAPARCWPSPACRRSSPRAASRSSTRCSSTRRGWRRIGVTSTTSCDALTAANQNATAGFQVAQGAGVPGPRRRAARRRRRHRRRAGEATGPCRCSSATSAPCARARRSSAARARTTRSRPSSRHPEAARRQHARADAAHRARRWTTSSGRLPPGMQIHRDLFRQADFIEQSLAQPVHGLPRRRRPGRRRGRPLPDERARDDHHAARAAAVAGRRGDRAWIASG